MPSTEQDQHETLRRIDGRLHSVRELRDEAGQVIGTVTKQLRVEFKWEDFGQLVAGACVMAIPLAFTEEVWDLGEMLPAGRILLISAVSVLTLAVFVWALFYGRQIGAYKAEFVKRTVSAYLVTLLVALLLLVLIDKGPLDDFALALRRAVLIAFPAAFAATAVDYIK